MIMEKEISSDLPSSFTWSRWIYDVFLSFRGKDTRNNFISHLYSALDQKGIFTFKDNHRLERGKVILSELFKAIEESRFSVIIFSENYAYSTWCLDELAKILECMKVRGQIVLPVFYNVTPSEVRNQAGSFEQAFAEHKMNFREDLEKVQKWRVAMTEIANLSGWHLQDREESKFIKCIVHEISSKLSPALLNTTGNLVGVDSRMEQIEPLLGIGLNDVRMLGIYGMGGIGKTTIARFVFDKISYQFDGGSFLANVREISKTRGLVALQQQLISETLIEKNINVWDVHRGCNEIRRRLRHKKVLVILDDIDQLEQLRALAGMHDWFGLGSRIIITTRDQHLLNAHGMDYLHMVDGLNPREARQLFYWKAFRKRCPTDDYLELSLQMVSYADGLPLALEVLGSFLFGRSKAEWKDALDRLKKVPDQKIFQILKISYDGLQESEKKIFLDVACFFKGRDKDEVREILDSCDFHPDIGISVLIDKCIITLSNNMLCMHDLIQYMGWEIVRQEYPEKPGQRSRLWLSNDICRVLTKNEGTEAVEGIILDFTTYEKLKLNANSFSRMNSLRLLKIKNVSLREGLEDLSDELRLLNWHGYPLRSLPSNFQHNKLFEVNMCYSHLTQLWKGVKHMNQLKIIILSHSTYLTETPDFTGVPNLEKLVLDGCSSLSFVHPSIGLLKRLILLNLTDCKQLRSIRAKTEWESLEVLILSGCSKLIDVQEILANGKHLLQLLLDETSIKELPSSIQYLTGLITLDLRNCRNLVSLPSSICNLRSLKVLNLNGCSKLDNLPQNLGHVASLENLDLGGTAISQPPSSIALLKNLKQLSFRGCKGKPLKSWSLLSLIPLFPRANLSDSMGLQLPSLSGLCSLRKLDLGDCNLQEGTIPSDLGFLPSLIELNLSRNKFISLPASIRQLRKLAILVIDDCDQLKALPELPASTNKLFAQNCTSMEIISSSSHVLTSRLQRMFYLSNCFKLAGSQCSSMTITFFKSVLHSLLNGQLQGLDRLLSQPEFEIVVPGSQVPDWFIYQSKGSFISILPPMKVSCIKFGGLALCAAFSVHQESCYQQHTGSWMELDCIFVMGNTYKHFISMPLLKHILVGSDHLWLVYISNDFLPYDFLDVDSEVHFKDRDRAFMVKECGLRLVDSTEMEEFVRASNNPSSSTSSVDLNRDTFGVKSAIIKRSRDSYCSDKQLYSKRLR